MFSWYVKYAPHVCIMNHGLKMCNIFRYDTQMFLGIFKIIET